MKTWNAVSLAKSAICPGVAPVSAVRIGVDQFPDREAVRRLFGGDRLGMGCSSVKLVGVRSPRERTTFEYSYDSFG